ncbi:MAG TPA: IPT/TIG domain-containing protein [Marmoricola sp.]|nr:IPT/TIG domain-containing protein [Marmoricola sp.]
MSVALARRFKVDVSTDGTTWIKLGGINDFAPTENATTQPADTYDTNGFNSFEKTMTGWKLVTKFYMPTTASVPSDPGQAILQATRFQFGTAARTYVRWYDRNGGTEAYSGLALVDWNQSKTSVPDIAEVTATLTGDGVLTAIANPYASTAVPQITSVTPSAQTVTNLITITGNGFIGTIPTSGVTVGGVNSTGWTVVSDNTIIAKIPTGTAGSAPIIVTNAIGASSSFAYTRGA